ncbi:hypothetical protein D4L85_27975 [Chryseolinea soli]|uniref:Uncharacterized protein n=1 Tax=Chryseolinea soli TaxID=2321403 RepID=A0A385SQV4_9BACT|nr:hypothetical protein D4L85_27975 [Chryseolinea soli]
MGTVKSNKKRKRNVTNEFIRDWIWNIENDPHAIEKARYPKRNWMPLGCRKRLAKTIAAISFIPFLGFFFDKGTRSEQF